MDEVVKVGVPAAAPMNQEGFLARFGLQFDESETPVQDPGAHDLEVCLVEESADGLSTSAAEDQREDHQPKAVDQPVPEHRAHECQVAGTRESALRRSGVDSRR